MHKSEFTLMQEKELPEVGGLAKLWKHKQSGAELLSILNQDENKCFGVSFYTPPEDSTGVAHILEHSVLCGSERYPVKEPFVELLKGSLQTFLNAFTFPDKTCYPVASTNLKDFYNLIDVYLDAVFHPRLTEDIFKQEGWHLDAQDNEQPWTYKGVVYNEMKGVYSSPEASIAEQSQQSLFPDNLYSLDSGGNPQNIPDLGWETFRNFHHEYYQPGNARFFFWGNDPEDERLRIVNEAIGNGRPVNHLPEISLQMPFDEPKIIEKSYAANDGRALFTLNWLLPERGNIEESLKMEMLEHILEGLPGSPLRRALIESGLGEDTIGCGLETDLRQMYYSTGLKGINPEDIEKAENLILTTLQQLVQKGIDAETVEAAVNSIEFAYRESNTGRFPRGLSAMIQALSTWLYGKDPLTALAWEKPLEEIKLKLKRGDKIFEQAIKDYFLNNPHRTRVSLLPDQTLADKRQQAEVTRLKYIRDNASKEERLKVVEDTERLLKAQLTPDRPEDLAKIPALAVSDLPLKNTEIPIEIDQGEQTFIYNALPANGILYTNLLLPVPQIPEHLLPLLPLFARTLTDLGAANLDYSELGKQIASKTGGIAAQPIALTRYGDGDPLLYLSISGKAVSSHIDDLFYIYEKILTEPQQNQDIVLERLGQMILEDKARLEYGLQAAGHAAISSRIKAHFRTENAISEQFAGISQLDYLKDLEKRLHVDPKSVLTDIEELRKLIISSKNAIINLAGEDKNLSKSRLQAEKVLNALPKTPSYHGTGIKNIPPLSFLPKAEIFITQGQINYVGKGANIHDLGYNVNGSIGVIMHWLRMGKLWEDIRVAGGAYGAFCNLDKITGNFVCASYRDPNIEKTLSVYDNLGNYLKTFTPSTAQLSQAKVGAVGALDTYLLPDAKAAKALGRYLTGYTAQIRQQERDEMLGSTAKDFRDFADALDAASQNGIICVIGENKAGSLADRLGWSRRDLI